MPSDSEGSDYDLSFRVNSTHCSSSDSEYNSAHVQGTRQFSKSRSRQPQAGRPENILAERNIVTRRPGSHENIARRREENPGHASLDQTGSGSERIRTVARPRTAPSHASPPSFQFGPDAAGRPVLTPRRALLLAKVDTSNFTAVAAENARELASYNEMMEGAISQISLLQTENLNLAVQVIPPSTVPSFFQ